jgi:hypothetical protein
VEISNSKWSGCFILDSDRFLFSGGMIYLRPDSAGSWAGRTGPSFTWPSIFQPPAYRKKL